MKRPTLIPSSADAAGKFRANFERLAAALAPPGGDERGEL